MASGIAFIVLLGLLAGALFRKMKLPELVGMLIVGVVCGPFALNLLSPELLNVSSDIRVIALIIILLRAGLALRRNTLQRVGKPVLIMAVVPAVTEASVITLVAPLILDIGYFEAALLGAILAAVSPAVVVLLMINFMDKKMGVKKGIPTLILGASSLNIVFVIVIFTILMGMATGSESNIFVKLLEIPGSVILGVAVGVLAGYILYRIFQEYNIALTKMTLIVVAVSILLTVLEESIKAKIAFSALIGVMTIGFVLLEKAEEKAHLISQQLSKTWILAEVLLFVLVGAQVDLQVAWKAGVAGVAVIFLGLAGRSVGVWFSLIGTNLNFKERLFAIISYTPKATVQAAIGVIPLEAGLASGNVILAVAVMSIVITAPLGAIGMVFTGERWLEKED